MDESSSTPAEPETQTAIETAAANEGGATTAATETVALPAALDLAVHAGDALRISDDHVVAHWRHADIGFGVAVSPHRHAVPAAFGGGNGQRAWHPLREFIRADESVEVTPAIVRLRKSVLTAEQRGKVRGRERSAAAN